MEKSGQLIKSFIGTMLVFTAFGYFLSGHSLSEMPWHLFAPIAAILAFTKTYLIPRFKKEKE